MYLIKGFGYLKLNESFMFYCYFQLARILIPVLRKYLKLQSYSRICDERSHFFQQISTLELNFTTKFLKFQIRISVKKFTTNNVSKTLFCIKIDQQLAEILSKEGWKACENWKNMFFYGIFIYYWLEIWCLSFDDISAICKTMNHFASIFIILC